ncbi:MAG TPA: septum formation initiator family protein [Candidatus Binataceae bacterium]|nr:septum formation initiator family protein [Candidatus Binataceae bacterium]
MGSLSSALRRRWPSLILAALLIGFALNCATGPNGAWDLMTLARHRTRLIADNERLKSENAQLESEINRLRTDDDYVQRVIRQELGWARPDEFVYRFHSSDQSRH